jgi:hypothetical protein
MIGTPNGQQNGKPQANIAYIVLGFGAFVVFALSVIGIIVSKENTMTIFNIVLPVIATWVGTVLAFYFGKQNYEAASQQALAATKQVSTDDVGDKPVTAIMMPFKDIVCYIIPQGTKDDTGVMLSFVSDKITSIISRVPILNSDLSPKYMIHKKDIDDYNGRQTKRPDSADTLAKFIGEEKSSGIEFGENNRFVVVSSQTKVDDAKKRMDKANCKDIFVTENGNATEPLIGWIPDSKLHQYFES